MPSTLSFRPSINIENELLFLRPNGRTTLLDAIHLGFDERSSPSTGQKELEGPNLIP
jgi:hypothetical protein